VLGEGTGWVDLQYPYYGNINKLVFINAKSEGVVGDGVTNDTGESQEEFSVSCADHHHTSEN